MSSFVSGRIGTFVIVFLSVLVIAGGILIWMRFPRSPGLEISVAVREETPYHDVTVNGAVNSPGIYSVQSGDTIEVILQAAGGTLPAGDTGSIQIIVPYTDELTGEQKIDINHAGSWLLEALPGIGTVLASRIVQYREQEGYFRNVRELTQVDGITLSVYEKIRDKITVTDGLSNH